VEREDISTAALIFMHHLGFAHDTDVHALRVLEERRKRSKNLDRAFRTGKGNACTLCLALFTVDESTGLHSVQSTEEAELYARLLHAYRIITPYQRSYVFTALSKMLAMNWADGGGVLLPLSLAEWVLEIRVEDDG
jgi:hypothetical protein